jgi:phage baseplate assembly protein W
MSVTEPVVIPHFQWPWSFDTSTGVAVVEQDTIDETYSNVQFLVACPAGAWQDQPSFGIPSPLFSQAPVDTNGIEQAIVAWEPRAAVAAIEYSDVMSDAIRHVRLNISTQPADQ